MQTFLHLASNAQVQENLEAAKYYYQQVLELDPDQVDALVRLGNILVEDGDPASAERYLSRAFYANPDDRDVLLPLGFLLVSRGKAHLAVSMLSRAAALYPDDPDMARMLGIACRSMGWHQAAEVQFLRAWELDPSGSDAPYNLAILYATRDQPRYKDARKWYEIAIKNGGAQDPQLERFLNQQAVAVRNGQP